MIVCQTILFLSCEDTVEHGAAGRIVSAAGARTLNFDLGKPDQPPLGISHYGFNQNCTFDEKEGKGVCVDSFVLPDNSEAFDQELRSIFTKPYTYTGPLVPYATVTIGASRSNAIAEFGLVACFLVTLLSTWVLHQI